MSKSIAYRPDIDGLRAAAVIAVIAYHYGATWLPGGFVGVDVFFVISGFLITSLIRRELEEGSFTFRRFWMRRVRRIMPALLVMILTSLVVGWLVLMPGDLLSLGYQASTAALGASNFYFWRTSGYFDQVADLIPLLHTWSLGVEEQFYVVWPLVLLAAWKVSKGRTAAIFAAVLLAVVMSFALSLYLTNTRPVAAFYLAPSRGWELALGAALTFLPHPRNAFVTSVAGILGAAALAVAFLTLTTRMPFPGWAAVVPAAGAALLIYAGGRGNIVSSFAGWWPFVTIGKLSYSLYLWHWPVWVFYRHYNNGSLPDAFGVVVLVCVTAGLAYLSWRFVEEPFRRRVATRRILAGGAAMAAAIACLVVSIGATQGGLWRIPERMRGMDSLQTMWEWDCPSVLTLDGDYKEFGEVCTFGADWDTAEQKAVIWGDSHAEHMVPLLEALIGDRSISVRLLRLCAATISQDVQYTRADVAGYTDGCDLTRGLAIDYLNSDPSIDTLILAGYWWPLPDVLHAPGQQAGDRQEGLRLLRKGLESVIREAQRPDLNFFLIADIPHFGGRVPSTCNEPDALILRQPCDDEGRSQTREAHLAEKGDIVDALSLLNGEQVVAIDTGAGLCATGICLSELNGEFLYRDLHHLRRNLSWDTRLELARLLGLEKIFPPETSN